MAGAWVSINGRVCPQEQATISVFDHGFLYGDSVYETLRTYGGRPFLLSEHLVRLQQSGGSLQMMRDTTDAEVSTQVDHVLEAAGFPESLIRIIWSRGAGDISYDLDPQQHSTLVVIAKPFKDYPVEWFEKGIPVSLTDIRRNPISSLDPRIKTSNLLNPRLAYLQAKKSGATEAVMLNQQGMVSEGSRTNIFLVSGGRVRTPSVETGILNGITRCLAIQLCREVGIPCEEAMMPADELRTCDEMFMTSTTLGVMPLGSLDGRPVGDGENWPVTRRLMRAYTDFVARNDWRLSILS